MSNSGHPKDAGERRGLMLVISSPSGAGMAAALGLGIGSEEGGPRCSRMPWAARKKALASSSETLPAARTERCSGDDG